MTHRKDIDGLRALAVLAVIAYHVFPKEVQGGFVGVDIFFVISGFLISGIILDDLERNTFSFSEFYARRIRRLFPALLTVLLAVFCFGWFALFSDEFRLLGKHMAGGAGFISNILFLQESGYFDTEAALKPLQHLWSLGIEEQFYIAFPLMLYLLWTKRFDFPVFITVVCLVSFALNAAIYSWDSVYAFYSPVTRLWELLSGVLMTLLARNPDLRKKLKRKAGFGFLNDEWIDAALPIIGLVLVGVLVIIPAPHFPGFWALLPVMGACLLIASGPENAVSRFVLGNNAMAAVGLISYPLYLWHWPLLSFMRIVYGETPPVHLRITAVLAAFFLAWMTYEFIERPIRFGKGAKNKIAAVLVVFVVAVGCAGIWVYVDEGIPFRRVVVEYERSSNRNELLNLPFYEPMDSACLLHSGMEKTKNAYCRFSDVNSRTTVAIIGDSHALGTYQGIERINAKLGVNTIVMGYGSYLPFIGIEEAMHESLRKQRKIRTAKIIDALLNNDDIKRVFICTRGPSYIKGGELGSAEKWGGAIPASVFAASLQTTVTTLRNAGKEVFILSENPELWPSPRNYLVRPFRMVTKMPVFLKSVEFDWQKEYLQILDEIKGATVIRTLDFFCPQKECLVFSKEGKLLYRDNNHLSWAGNYFQAEHLLAGGYLTHENTTGEKFHQQKRGMQTQNSNENNGF
ncbi:MAG: acyltransferase [Candidatus Accumulibacter sp.]|jgi:peptidoglycan/LPS O-acetylase OafA/YrhL|nr:acyltransferase [Accumulibacter sp.]